MKRNLWLLLAGVLMLGYAAVTPPFQAPDEAGHFWRSWSIARGAIVPVREHGKPVAELPRGARDLVATLWVETAGKPDAKIGLERIREAMQVERGDEVVRVVTPAFYTPVPYAAQTLACFIGDRLALRPLLTFYLGRIFNAAAALALFAIAVRLARQQWAFIAVALLPMLLYLCGTFSADATTCGLAFVVTAMALRDDRFALFVVCAFLLALCKPAYFLLALLRVPRLTRIRNAILIVAIAAGAAISSANVRSSYYTMRTDVPVDPAVQMTNVRMAPLHFLRVVFDDYRHNGRAYAEQFIGRLGWLDVGLPKPLVLLTLALLALTGITSERIRARERLIGLAIALASMLMISLSQYLMWSPAGADFIEGIQGRYFLPLGPLALLLVSARQRYERAARAAFIVSVLALNVVAIVELARRYY